MCNEKNPIIRLAGLIESVRQIKPEPLSQNEIPDDSPECIVSIRRLDGQFGNCWQEIREVVMESLDEYGEFDTKGYSSRYLDSTDTTERLVLVREIWRGDERGVLKIEYHTSGNIQIKSFVQLHSKGSRNFPDILEEFICGDIESISSDDVTATKQRFLNLQA